MTTTDDASTVAAAWVASVRSAVGTADPDELRLTEQTAQQMGSEYVVRIGGTGDRTHDVVVVHNGGRYVVAPDATPTNPG